MTTCSADSPPYARNLVIGWTISILVPEHGYSVSLSFLIATAYRSHHHKGEDRSVTPAIVSAIGLYGTVPPRYRRTQSNTRPILLHRTNCDRAARRIYRRARALDSALHEACCMYVMAGALTLHCRKNSVKSCRFLISSAQTVCYVLITTFVVEVYLLEALRGCDRRSLFARRVPPPRFCGATALASWAD